MTGRVFGASLKPVWSEEKIQDFLNKTNGDIIVFIINHDKDVVSETGEIVEAHTHIYLEYSNPRKISTVANLLEVEANFIEIVRNKKGYLRYLTHMDEKDKFVYDFEEVYTNSVQTYEITVRGNAMSDKEIAEMIKQGKGLELLGVVSASKLRTIQSFLHFDTSNVMLQEIRANNKQRDQITEIIVRLDDYLKTIVPLAANGITTGAEGLRLIAEEIGKIRKLTMGKEI